MIIIIAVIIYYFVTIFYLRKKGGKEFFISLVIFLSCVLIGCFCPLNGFTDYELVYQENLISFTSNENSSDEKQKEIYVINFDDIEYKYMVKNSDSNKNEVKTVKRNVSIQESNEYTVPCICTYIREGKFSIWSFGGVKQKKTVFYIPSGTVSNKS